MHKAWEAFLARTDLVGGDVQLVSTEGNVFRGQLVQLRREGDELRFISPSLAHLHPKALKEERWHWCAPFEIRVNMRDTEPEPVRTGNRVLIRVQHLGCIIVFPKDDNNLNHDQVRGQRLAVV